MNLGDEGLFLVGKGESRSRRIGLWVWGGRGTSAGGILSVRWLFGGRSSDVGESDVIQTRQVKFRALNVRFTPSKVENRPPVRLELYNISKAQLRSRSGGCTIVKTSFNGGGDGSWVFRTVRGIVGELRR